MKGMMMPINGGLRLILTVNLKLVIMQQVVMKKILNVMVMEM
jgi:hypothetical protein